MRPSGVRDAPIWMVGRTDTCPTPADCGPWVFELQTEEEYEEGEMIEGKFDSRTLANMNVALDRVCEKATHGEDYVVRKRVA